MIQCDLAVVGGGPGGYVAAIRAAQSGGSVVLVERDQLGGVCLNSGCIPTKTLLHTAELYRKLEHAGEIGIRVKGAVLDVPALIAHKNKVVKGLRSGVSGLLKANGVEVVKGDARVTAPGRVAVGPNEIAAQSVILATGGAPGNIRGLETDGETVITSTEALDLERVPERVAVIGAGPLGAEFACLWNAFGAHVTLIEMLANVLPLEDDELTKKLAVLFKKRGIDVRTKTTVANIDSSRKGVRLELDGPKQEAVDVDLVLVGVGRSFNTEVVAQTPGLGVKLSENGAIQADERMETNIPGLYAIGDVVGKTLLAHGASAEGIVAAGNALGHKKTMDYDVVPACSFTVPELARVGMTEKEAREAGVDVKVGRFPYAAVGRARAMGETDGMVKIVGDAATDQVLGVHILGASAGELIAAAALAIRLEATVDDIAHTIHTHPTLAETVMGAAEDYFGTAIHTAPRKP